ncbi:type VI secretion system contractile sheath small subunit [Pseudomonas sp. G11]|nr:MULTISPECIES: type VI secretion system contractile sheath small subunit [Pseudomonas]WEX19158.1 type VI secretion system contractile sheath small subunit [Pseudomonas sp. G11]
MERLMELRNALVALKGPLSNDPKVRENLQERLLSDELHNRILGQVCQAPTPSPQLN